MLLFPALAICALPSLCAAGPLARRQNGAIPLVNSTLPGVVSVTLTDGGSSQNDIITTCDRSTYQVSLNTIEDGDFSENSTFRFVLGQPRYGQKGGYLEGDAIFLDKSYNLSQASNRVPFPASGSDPARSLLTFPLYPGGNASVGDAKWTLGTDNGAQKDQLAIASYIMSEVFVANGTSSTPIYGNVTLQADCTAAYEGQSSAAKHNVILGLYSIFVGISATALAW